MTVRSLEAEIIESFISNVSSISLNGNLIKWIEAMLRIHLDRLSPQSVKLLESFIVNQTKFLPVLVETQAKMTLMKGLLSRAKETKKAKKKAIKPSLIYYESDEEGERGTSYGKYKEKRRQSAYKNSKKVDEEEFEEDALVDDGDIEALAKEDLEELDEADLDEDFEDELDEEN